MKTGFSDDVFACILRVKFKKVVRSNSNINVAYIFWEGGG